MLLVDDIRVNRDRTMRLLYLASTTQNRDHGVIIQRRGGMRAYGLLIAVSCGLSLSGCVQQGTSYQPTTAYSVPKLRNTVEVKDDQFEKSITFHGAEEVHGNYDTSASSRTFLIRSWLNKSDFTVKHQLYVNDYYYSDWKFWNSAKDDGANVLQFVSISRDVGYCSRYGGCSHYETFGASLDDATLRAKRASGYSIKFSAKSGDEKVIYVTPQQIAAQLDAIDARRPAPPPAPTAPVAEKTPEAKPAKKKK